MTPLQPPIPMALLDNHVANVALTAACVWQEGLIDVPTIIAKFESGAAATVKVAWQVVVNGAQVLV
jgi:hypothetical protein